MTMPTAVSIAVFSFLMFGICQPTKAGVIEDIRGILTDPLKLEKGADTLVHGGERILEQAAALEKMGDKDIEKRLEQLRTILLETIGKGDEAVSSALSMLSDLEKQVNKDAMELIYAARCLGPQIDQDIQSAFAELVKGLHDANIDIAIFGLPVGYIGATPVSVVYPEQSFYSAIAETYKALDNGDKNHNGQLSDNSYASDIFWAYQHLILIGQAARCKYLGLDAATVITGKVNELRQLSRPWIDVVRVNFDH